MRGFFIQPSKKVREIIKSVESEHFYSESRIVHKAAIVLRTGVGDYNQFLSQGDELNFVKCFQSYAKKFVQGRNLPKDMITFKVLVTSDNNESKNNAVKELKKLINNDGYKIHPIMLNDSAIHVMHMAENEHKEAKGLEKLLKTYAEFFLIGECDVRFLTFGSLFGKVASENTPDHTNFIISDSNCDGTREKYSYLECNSPKYPMPLCSDL